MPALEPSGVELVRQSKEQQGEGKPRPRNCNSCSEHCTRVFSGAGKEIFALDGERVIVVDDCHVAGGANLDCGEGKQGLKLLATA